MKTFLSEAHVFAAAFVVFMACTGNAEAKVLKTAVFAGGCFWCMEAPFEEVDGVTDVISGYMGGKSENPTYKNYANKGYIEVIQITFDPSKITYGKLLDIFWQQIDPTDANGQFVDRGLEYRSAVFFLNEEQRKTAKESKAMLDNSDRFEKPVVTELIPASVFYKAEDYHQNYYKDHSIKYKYYRSRSGRDKFLKKYWGNDMKPTSKDRNSKYTKPSDEDIKKKLTPLQYEVTQKEGTEHPFDNAYWDNKKEGIYVDIVSGEPLYSSLDKFKSGTGWPSFTKSLEVENIVEKEDRRLFSVRIEVRSKHGDSHLGHVFNDGPAPTGLRHCINSAALRFIAKENLEKEGYGEYNKYFEK